LWWNTSNIHPSVLRIKGSKGSTKTKCPLFVNPDQLFYIIRSLPLPQLSLTIKERYTSESAIIFQEHRAGADGFAIAARLTSLVDATLTELWNTTALSRHDDFAVVALGGYGRFELCPHSDFDLMILAKDEKAKRSGAEAIQLFLHSLWDAGFTIGHSVRAIQDCVNLYETDIDSWASILESRFVCGGIPLREYYADAVFRTIRKKFDLVFVRAIIV